MRVCVFGERLTPPPDEGIKKLTLSVAAACRKLGHETLALTNGAPSWPEAGVEAVEADRLLRSEELARRLGAFNPDAVVYVPTASLTLAAGLRSRTLRCYARGAPVALFATQGRRHTPAVRLAARLAGPDLCAAQSEATVEQARRLGWRALRLPPGVDLATFCPSDPAAKRSARRQFGLHEDAFVVLHAGHLNRSRGVADLLALADMAVPVLAGSTSTAQDGALARELEAGGVRVLAHFIPSIAYLYAAADTYLFPVPPDPLAPSSIDVPLSALEAAACDLPIVATPFGALPELWPAAAGVSFYRNMEELRAAVARLKSGPRKPGGTRVLAEPYSWESLASRLLAALTGQAVPA